MPTNDPAPNPGLMSTFEGSASHRAIQKAIAAGQATAPTVIFLGTTELFYDRGVWNVRLSGDGLSAPVRFQPPKDSSNAKSLRAATLHLMLDQAMENVKTSLALLIPANLTIEASRIRTHHVQAVLRDRSTHEDFATFAATAEGWNKTGKLVIDVKIPQPEATSALEFGIITTVATNLGRLLTDLVPHFTGMKVQLIGDIENAPKRNLAKIEFSEILWSGLLSIKVNAGEEVGQLSFLRTGIEKSDLIEATLVATEKAMLVSPHDQDTFNSASAKIDRAVDVRTPFAQLRHVTTDRKHTWSKEGFEIVLGVQEQSRIGELHAKLVIYTDRERTVIAKTHAVRAAFCFADKTVQVAFGPHEGDESVLREGIATALQSLAKAQGWGFEKTLFVAAHDLTPYEGEFTDSYDPENEWGYNNHGLYRADPECHHQIVSAPGGGVKCKKCDGWYCA